MFLRGTNPDVLNGMTWLDKASRLYTDGISGRRLGPGETVLASDGTMAQDGSNFTSIGGGWPDGKHTTSHVGTRGLPSGRNILYLDSHVEWKSFSSTEANALSGLAPAAVNSYGITVIHQNSGNVNFFW